MSGQQWEESVVKVFSQMTVVAELRLALLKANPGEAVSRDVHQRLCQLIQEAGGWCEYEGLREALDALLALEQMTVSGCTNYQAERQMKEVHAAAHRGESMLFELSRHDEKYRH